MELISLTVLLHKLLKRRDIQSTNTFLKIGNSLTVHGPLLVINISGIIFDGPLSASNLIARIQELAAAGKHQGQSSRIIFYSGRSTLNDSQENWNLVPFSKKDIRVIIDTDQIDMVPDPLRELILINLASYKQFSGIRSPEKQRQPRPIAPQILPQFSMEDFFEEADRNLQKATMNSTSLFDLQTIEAVALEVRQNGNFNPAIFINRCNSLSLSQVDPDLREGSNVSY